MQGFIYIYTLNAPMGPCCFRGFGLWVFLYLNWYLNHRLLTGFGASSLLYASKKLTNAMDYKLGKFHREKKKLTAGFVTKKTGGGEEIREVYPYVEKWAPILQSSFWVVG